jgi:hypothetical protein
MSRTTHHRNQGASHEGYDYGGRYKHNKHYGGGYGVDGRNAADSERRSQDKIESKSGIDDYVNGIFEFWDTEPDCYVFSDAPCDCGEVLK